jgi:NAD(P)-dependent dehydrogenase (short-subunit alcohol dehydrogenase family)
VSCVVAKTEERRAGLTSTMPIKRVGKPEEIAQAIVFVSSEKASFITGASYLVEGGKRPYSFMRAVRRLKRRTNKALAS